MLNCFPKSLEQFTSFTAVLFFAPYHSQHRTYQTFFFSWPIYCVKWHLWVQYASLRFLMKLNISCTYGIFLCEILTHVCCPFFHWIINICLLVNYLFLWMPVDFPGDTVVKSPPASAGDTGDAGSVPREGPLEEEMATHSSILTWKIP